MMSHHSIRLSAILPSYHLTYYLVRCSGLLVCSLHFRPSNRIEKETIFLPSQISFEFLEDDQFVLFSLNISDKLIAKNKDQILTLQKILNANVPKRIGEYAWMVNFIFANEVIESIFGGDILAPSSGLL